MPNPSVRDAEADYKAALLAEYEGYVRRGKTAEARNVAKVLKDQYGHEVEKPAKKTTARKAAAERADVKRPAEDTAEPRPRHKA